MQIRSGFSDEADRLVCSAVVPSCRGAGSGVRLAVIDSLVSPEAGNASDYSSCFVEDCASTPREDELIEY